MVDKKVNEVSLENLAKEKLSPKILIAIENIDDIEFWERLDTGLALKVNKRSIEFRLFIKTSTKKMMKWFGSLTTVTGGTIMVLKWLLPVLIEYFSNSPP
jgi:hypothetical protein